MLIGSPLVDGATIKLGNGHTLSIKVFDNSDTNVYVKKVIFNGKEIQNYRFTVKELMSGGELSIYMTH